jgi:hypothetical protein
MDYGANRGELSEGLASGIAGGIGNLLAARQQNKLEAERAKDRQIRMRQAGLIEDESGQLAESTEAKRQRTLNEALQKGGLLSRGIIVKEGDEGFDIERDPTYKDPYARRAELEAAKLAREEDPRYRLRKEGGEVKKQIGMVASALEGLKNYEDLFKGGMRPERITRDTPLLGSFVSDTPLTVQATTIAEVVGRLQSGGAINKDEEKRFMAMLPRPGDTEDVAAQKLDTSRRFIESKLTALGYQPQDLAAIGFEPDRLGYGDSLRGLLAQEGSTPSAVAAPGTPEPGVEEDGYQFLGGDPSDKRNWKKVK